MSTVVSSSSSVPQAARPEENQEDAAMYQSFGAPRGCSRVEIDRRLYGIHWRLDKVSFQELRDLSTEVPKLVEAMRVATEWLAWSEGIGESMSFIDLFHKYEMLEKFTCALRMEACPLDLKVQVMQSFAILMPRMRCGTSLDYLLGVLNPVFSDTPKLDDEDLLAYLVQLLKGLALRLDAQSVNMCIVEERSRKQIPVLDCAAGLAFHANSMVSSAAQLAVLSILRLDNSLVRLLAEDIVSQRVVSNLALFAKLASAGQKQKCRWMWGDALTGSLSEKNPLRWSDIKGMEAIIAEIALATHECKRSVLVQTDPGRVRCRYRCGAEACAALSLQASTPSLNTLLEFAEALLELDRPSIAQAMESSGFVLRDNAPLGCCRCVFRPRGRSASVVDVFSLPDPAPDRPASVGDVRI